ncbi:PAS domain-containing sensor histidine kinase [Flaviaesturariibacter terrae]
MSHTYAWPRTSVDAIAVVNGAPGAALCLEEDGLIASWNEKAALLLGLTKGGNQPNIAHFLATADEGQFMALLARVTESGQGSSSHFTIPNTNSSVEAQLLPLGGKHSPVLLLLRPDEASGPDAARNRSAALLEPGRELYRQIVENCHEGVCLVDSDGQIVLVNYQAASMLGYTESELVGKPASRLVNTDLYQSFDQQMAGRRQGLSSHYECCLRKKDGSSVWAMVAANPIFEGEEFVGTLAMLADITERKAMEQELNHSLQRFHLALQATRDGVWEWEIRNCSMYFSPRFCEILGYSFDDPALERTYEAWAGRLHPDHRESVEAQLQAHLLGGPPLEAECLHLHASGEYRWQKVTGQAQFDEAGKALRMAGSIRDISQIKEAEAAFLQEQELSNSIIGSLPGVFYVLDEHGRLRRWNENLEKVSGYNHDEVAGLAPLDLVVPEDRALVLDVFERALRTGDGSVEIRLQHRDGKARHFYFNGKLTQLGGQPALVGMGIDISEHKKMEQLLRQSFQEIRELASHLQDVREKERTEIAHEIHDELGQSLTAIKMNLASILRKRPGTEEVIAKVEESLDLTEQTIHAVRRIATEMRPTLLDDLGLIEALRWYCDTFAKRLEISLSLDVNCADAVTDPRLSIVLFRIVQESLTNIARHASAKRVDMLIEQCGSTLSLRIEDDGVGFDVGQSRKADSIGILGLKERAKSINGDYSINSRPGRGTVVQVSVPDAFSKTN